MTDDITITGGAGPQETAAILAAVARVLQDEAAARANPPAPPRQSSWVMAWRPREVHAPMPSQTFDAARWAATGEITPED